MIGQRMRMYYHPAARGNASDPSLLFPLLKSEGLVQNYHEWRAIDTAFKHKHNYIPATSIKKWLKHQKGHFRTSYLSALLIAGYSRTSKPSLFNTTTVPKEIEDIIVLYVNLTFIKMYTSSDDNYSLYTFDCNYTLSNLLKIMERLEIQKDFGQCRLFTRFDIIKFIYSVQKGGQIWTNYSNEQQDEKDKQRWVQIPDDFAKQLTLKDLDNKLRYDQVLEFGFDTLGKVYFDRGLSRPKWTFLKCEKRGNDGLNLNFNQFEWVQSLKIGDVIDVYYGYSWMKGFIFCRDYDTFYIHLDSKRFYIEIKSIGTDFLRQLRPRNAGQDCEESKLYRKPDNLVFCSWSTAFKGLQQHYPLLFE